jgi:hypothetical protein
MTRAALIYADATERRDFAPGVDPETPIAGCYRVKLGRWTVPSAVHIWFGCSIDPATGEEMSERSPMWQATRNGAPVDVFSVWPDCAREMIARAEHDRIAANAQTMDPDSPYFDPRKPVDLNTASMPF